MSFLVFLPVMLSVGICLVPVFILRRSEYKRAQDYFVSSQPAPPNVIRNASVAYAVRMAAFGPFFAWGASGDFWPAIISSVCFGLGIYLIYILRRPMLYFLDHALVGDRSITVHEFIARRHGNDPRVRLFAASLTIFALIALVAGEAFAVAALLKPIVTGYGQSIHLVMVGLFLLMALYAVVSGNSGAMHSAQLQLGMLYLGLFGSTALLLYLHVSALTPMPPQGAFAVVFVTACCALVLYYRRSKYVDTSPVAKAGPTNNNEIKPSRRSPGAGPLRVFEKILNPCISVFAVLIIVLALMEFYSAGIPALARDSVAVLQMRTGTSGVGLVALALLPLFYPLIDITNWQRIAAAEKDRDRNTTGPSRRSAALRGIFRTYALESPLLCLFMCMFGAVATMSMQAPAGADMVGAFMQQLVSARNPVTAAALSLLLVSVAAMALSTMSSAFSASLCTIRYDLLPAFWPKLVPGETQAREAIARRRTLVAGGALFLLMLAAFCVADTSLQISVTSSTFLALIFAFCCAQLSFAPLILGPMIARTTGGGETVSPGWALAILGIGAASGLGAVTGYLATGMEPWLWAAVPICLGSGFLLFAAAQLWPGNSAGPA
jgi:hypothetical protein